MIFEIEVTSTVGKSIKKRRQQLNMTQTELSKACGIAQSIISDIERGRSKKTIYIMEIATALKMPAEAIMRGTWELPALPGDWIDGEYYPISSTKLPVSSPTVPVISWGSVGQVEQEILDNVPCTVDHSTETFCLRMVGSSMSPLYQHGDIIYIDPAKHPHHGCRVLAIVNGSPVMRGYEEESDGVYLTAANPEHPGRKVLMGEGDRIVGRVIYMGRPE